LAGIKFYEFTCFEHLAKKVWQMNRFSQKVIIVSRNLDGNQGQFTKFAKLSPAKLSRYMVLKLSGFY